MSRSRRFLYPLFLLAMALAIAFSAPAAELSKELRKTIPLGPDGRVEIETYKGSVEVAAEERADVVVDNGGDLASLRSRAGPLLAALRSGLSRRLPNAPPARY